MKKTSAIFLTAIITIISLFLSIFYWPFSAIEAPTVFLFSNFIIFSILTACSLVSFYRTATKRKNKARITLNFFLSLLIVPCAFSIAINGLNVSIFNWLHGGKAMINRSEIKSKEVCGYELKNDSVLFKSSAFIKNGDEYYVTVFCPGILYKSDDVVIDKALVEAFIEGRKNRGINE